jgi:hypothetical protein
MDGGMVPTSSVEATKPSEPANRTNNNIEAIFDEEHGAYYYVNTVTGQTAWTQEEVFDLF